jgi:caa(3)-type oxidase subunit IV|uniref:Cytochrome C oxidase subunit IV n=1 Tax=Anaerolinea thermolimosa TaxID=229919 RepID=A0A7C4KI76_9CHLR
MEPKTSPSRPDELRRGVLVFVFLAILTAIEYFIGTHELPSILLWVIALVKAGLVIWYFMHLKRAFREEGEHE